MLKEDQLNNNMNILSLFDGMSCGQIALNKLGIKYDNYFASEIDKYAIQVTMENYPNTKQIGSVVDVKAEDLPKIDLMFGGSPCTNFSFAGRQKGMSTKDEVEITTLNQYLKLKEESYEFEGQSYLFWEYIRILHEVKPKYFMLENVKMAKKWEDVISNTLGVKPIKIDSRLVSAQKRQRLYWTNIPNIEQPEDKKIMLKDILIDRNNPLLEVEIPTEKRIAYIKRRAAKGWVKDTFNNINTEKAECITAVCYKTMKEYVYEDNNGLRFLSCVELERLQTVSDNYTSICSKTQRRKMLGNGWTVDVIAHIFKDLN